MTVRENPNIDRAAFDLQTERIIRAANRGELTPDEIECAYAHRGLLGTICAEGEYQYVTYCGQGTWAPLYGVARAMRSDAWRETMRIDDVVRASKRARYNHGGRLMRVVREESEVR